MRRSRGVFAVPVGVGSGRGGVPDRVRCPEAVGARDDRETLRRVLDEAGAGAGGLVAVLGPAGIGKTRLVDGLRGDAERRGMSVLAGRAVDRRTPAAYRPITEAVLPVLAPEEPARGARHAAFRAALAGLVPGGSSEEPGGLALVEGLARLLSSVGGDEGCLLVLEDLHWADPETVAVVEDLAHHLDDRPVACVATVRTGREESPERRIRRLGERRVARLVELAPLVPAQVGEMVARCLGPAAVPAAVTDFVREHADGIPLLVEELLEGLLTDGALQLDDGRWRVARDLAPRVPVTFAQTVRRRLDELAADDRAVVRAAAVVGRRLDPSLLAAATGTPREQVLGVLHRAAEVGLVDRDGDLRFRHALAREAVAEELLAPERAAIARSALEALDEGEGPTEDHGLVADLAAEAGRTDRAVQALLALARDALRRGALASGDRALERARSLAGDPDTLLAVEQLQAHVAALGGHVRRAERRARRVLAGADVEPSPASGPDRGVRLDAVLARTAVAAGRLEEADRHARKALAGFDAEAMVPALGARLRALAAQVAASRGDVDRAVELASSVADEQPTGPDAVTARCEALEIRGRCVRPDDLDEAERFFERALELAERHDLPLWRARALHELGTIDLHRWSTRSDRLAAARDAARRLGAPATVALAELHLCAMWITGWDPDRSLRHGRRCIELSREHDLATLPGGLVHVAIAHALDDDEPAMRDALDEALAVAGEAPEVAAGAPGKARMALALRRGDLEGACSQLAEAADILREEPDLSFPFWGLWALLHTVVEPGDGTGVRDTARRLAGRGIVFNRVCLQLADAVAAGRAGRADEAAGLVAGVADSRAMTDPAPWRGVLLAALGEAAVGDGWGDGAAWLREAMAGFEQHELTELASRARAALRGAGLAVPRSGARGSAVPPALAARGVTGRELDVLDLLVDELSNPQIAERLHISRRTVERHVSNLLAKTGCEDRHGLARLGRDTARGSPGEGSPSPPTQSG